MENLSRIKVMVKSLVPGTVTYSNDMRHVRRIWQRQNQVIAIPADELQESIYDMGVYNLFHQGYVGIFHGTPVVTLPLATETEANLKWAYDPSYAFVMPAGKEKVVKIVLEGDLQINDWTNKDWSLEMQFYKKYGVGMLYFNNWGIYKDTSLSEDVMSA